MGEESWPVLATFSLLFTLTATATPPVGSPPVPTVEVEQPRGVLHGDWEAPRVVAIVYSEGWLEVLSSVIESAAPVVDIWMLVEEGARWNDARRFLRALPPATRARVHLLPLWTDTVWIRDYGPFQVRETNGSISWLDNAYIGDRRRDDRVPAHLAKVARVPTRRLEAAIDGGAMASNGAGLCVTTEEYLDSEGIEAAERDVVAPLARELGCRVLTAVPALSEEPTMHVDPFVQFLAPDKVAVATVDPTQHPDDHARLETTAAAIVSAGHRLGLDLEVVRVPLWVDGENYYSYINGLALADRFLVPSYRSVDEALEHEAHEALRKAMPERVLHPILADELVEAQGVIHCITLGLDVPPKPLLARRKRAGVRRHRA